MITINSNWKAGDKAYIIEPYLDEVKECEITNVTFASYLLYNDCNFVMKLIYKFADEDLFENSYEIFGEEEINKKVFKTKEEAEQALLDVLNELIH